MIFPNFLVIGAAKAGTTSLHHYLRQHPDVYLSSKELNYFAYQGRNPRFKNRDIWKATTLGRYRAHFRAAGDERAIGEVAPLYLRTPGSAEKIFNLLPDIKLLAILRAPADQAYSHYCMRVRHATETRSFCQSIADELTAASSASEIEPAQRHIAAGFYHQHLVRYYRLFAPSQLSIHLYEDLQNDPLRLMRQIFGFLGVDQSFVPDMSRRHNAADGSADGAYPFLLRQSAVSLELRAQLPPWVGERWSAFTRRFKKPPEQTAPKCLDPDIRELLVEHYREDTLRLQDLIGRDLSAWL